MSIYYFLIEAKPMKNNPELEYLSGAYVNCWVKADTTKEAIKKLKSISNGKNGNGFTLKICTQLNEKNILMNLIR